MPHTARHIYIATLGGQPQIVTLALDRLLAGDLPIEEAIVVHLAPRSPRYQTALDRLAREFPPYDGTCYTCRYRPHVVHAPTGRVEDLDTDPSVTAVCQTFHDLFHRLKQQDNIIHLCVSGGRRLLGILALSVAPFYFGYADRVWHLYSSDAVQQQTRNGALMHVDTTDDVRLIELSLFPGGRLLPMRQATWPGPTPVSPTTALNDMEQQDRRRCLQVWRKLTLAQQRVLHAFASGYDPQTVAEQLGNSLSTIDTHKTVIYAECRNAWNLPDGQPNHYSWLYRTFHPYLADLV